MAKQKPKKDTKAPRVLARFEVTSPAGKQIVTGLEAAWTAVMAAPTPASVKELT